MSEVVAVILFPAWKQAVQDFLAAGFKPGDVVKHAWLEQRFGIDALAENVALTSAAFKDRQFRWLQCVEAFKAELLEGHQIYLQSVHGEGFRWVPPHEQTSAAVERFEREAKHAYRKVGMRLTHLRAAELTDAQRRENMDAIGRISLLEGMQKAIE